jgi:hypothetical protein
MADCEILFSVPLKVRTRTAAQVCKIRLTPTSRKMAFRTLSLFLAHSALPKQFWGDLGCCCPGSPKNQERVASTKSQRPTAVIDHGIRGIGPWELHAIGELGWSGVLQHQLTGISVFALVALSGIRRSRMRIAITSAKTIRTRRTN